jgi:pectinesterase
MKFRLLTALVALPLAAFAADKFTITVSNESGLARPSETIAVPWSKVNEALPHAMIQHISVKDAAGHEVPFQVTNVAPESKDPQYIGVAYGDLLFQHDFSAGEKSASFTVEKTEAVSPPFPTKAFARYVPERLDDFAWENDRIGHRTYGPALAAPDTEKRGKEVLVTSGLDVWCKRVSYPIVDRWYNKGHDHYHHDEGEGMDMYQVGTSRGCGGTGVWDGSKLWVGRNYRTWKVIANGPVRAIFELTYEAWDANGVKVSEVKRFTVDAGHNLDQIDSTFTFDGPQELTVAVGLNKNNADKGQNPTVKVTKNSDTSGWLSQWTTQEKNDELGTAVVIPAPAFAGFAEDKANELVLAKVTSGKPLRYYVGAGWTRSGQFASQQDWEAYVAAEGARAKSPVKVTLSR